MENWWIDLNMTAIRQSEIKTRVTNNRKAARCARRTRPGRTQASVRHTAGRLLVAWGTLLEESAGVGV